MSGGPIPRSSVPDEVFLRLRDAILSGQYAAGERLPAQRALAADLQVNMASVREALKRLEQLRLVDVRHGEATRVLDWRHSGGLEALAVLGVMDVEVAVALFEARRVLLVESARLAAERRTDAQAHTLVELAAAMGVARDDETALLADWAFMAALVEATGNLIFQLIANSVRELYLPNAAAFAPLVAAREALAPRYREAADAIVRGDADAAAATIEALSRAQEQSMLAGA